MPRPVRRRHHRGPTPATQRPHAAPTGDPVIQLRSLIQDGVITAAALDASEDLTVAAASLQRLGNLTSGMWRALSRELANAAERLDRHVQERLDELRRRADALDVDPDAVMAAALAAAHLEEHQETLSALLPAVDEDVRRLAAPDVPLGFTVEDEVPLDDDEYQDDGTDESADTSADAGAGDGPRLGVRVWLFLWPAPLRPVGVTMVPDVDEVMDPDSGLATAVSVQVEAPDTALDQLTAARGLSLERILPTVSTLGAACWSAHEMDERGEEDEDDEQADGDADDAGDE